MSAPVLGQTKPRLSRISLLQVVNSKGELLIPRRDVGASEKNKESYTRLGKVEQVCANVTNLQKDVTALFAGAACRDVPDPTP
jgi:hypothetical protein